MRIIIFTEGTIIAHKNSAGFAREQIVQQIIDEEPSIHDYGSYVPIGDAVKKLTQWKNQGAEIFYLTSRRKPEEINAVKSVLQRYSFPDGQLLFREDGEKYKDVAEKIMPDVLIEDDCESIGGTKEMTFTHINPVLKAKIISMPVREFGGIDHLENKISAFLQTK